MLNAMQKIAVPMSLILCPLLCPHKSIGEYQYQGIVIVHIILVQYFIQQTHQALEQFKMVLAASDTFRHPCNFSQQTLTGDGRQYWDRKQNEEKFEQRIHFYDKGQ